MQSTNNRLAKTLVFRTRKRKVSRAVRTRDSCGMVKRSFSRYGEGGKRVILINDQTNPTRGGRHRVRLNSVNFLNGSPSAELPLPPPTAAQSPTNSYCAPPVRFYATKTRPGISVLLPQQLGSCSAGRVVAVLEKDIQWLIEWIFRETSRKESFNGVKDRVSIGTIQGGWIVSPLLWNNTKWKQDRKLDCRGSFFEFIWRDYLKMRCLHFFVFHCIEYFRCETDFQKSYWSKSVWNGKMSR